ncbi:hypothetical protein [Paenibacillus koleovorans]|uniref:hypothetical protein n=1 Tax=Paenibacillus koleovorans TaxID=121608 RepID=UPI000FDB9E34|nr:hypothetical protein [Paenibacillus koleovorans]
MDKQKGPLSRYNAYLYIWGAQWIFEALLIYFWSLEPQDSAVMASLWAALGGSAVVYGRRRKNGAGHRAQPAAASAATGASTATGASAGTATSSDPTHASAAALRTTPVAIAAIAGAAWSAALLIYAQPPALIAYDLIRALLLALIFVVIGAAAGRELVLLGVWLFALATIVAVWFLGYAPLVLMACGGASLFACTWIFRVWSDPPAG